MTEVKNNSKDKANNSNGIILLEANSEKYQAQIFPLPTAPNLFSTYTKVVKDSINGDVDIFRIIPANEHSRYTSRTYEVYCAVVMIWFEEGKPEEPMHISLSRIATVLNKSKNGNTFRLIEKELRCLYVTTMEWDKSFETPEGKKRSNPLGKFLDTFKYLSLDKLGEQKKSQASCEIRLDERIRINLRNKIWIPVNFKVRSSIKGAVGKVLYGKIDNVMCSKISRNQSTFFSWSAEYIINELQLKKSRYVYLSQRKILLQGILKNLNKKELSKLGYFLSVELAPTVDGRDYKLNFSVWNSNIDSDANSNGNLGNNKLPSIVNTDKQLLEDIVDIIAEFAGEREGNYKMYLSFARHYSYQFIDRAVRWAKESEINKLEKGEYIASKGAFFQTTLHRKVHEANMLWVNPDKCGKDCKIMKDVERIKMENASKSSQ